MKALPHAWLYRAGVRLLALIGHQAARRRRNRRGSQRAIQNGWLTKGGTTRSNPACSSGESTSNFSRDRFGTWRISREHVAVGHHGPVGPVKFVRWKPSRSIPLSISRRLLSSVLPASLSRYSTGASEPGSRLHVGWHRRRPVWSCLAHSPPA